MMLKTLILICICAPLMAAQRPSSLLGSSLDNTSSRTNFSLRNQGVNFPSNSNFDSVPRPFSSLGSTADLSLANSGPGLSPLLNSQLGVLNQYPYNQLLNQQIPYPYNQYPYNQYPTSMFLPQQSFLSGSGLGLSQLGLINNYPLNALYANQFGGGGVEPFYNNLLLSNRLQMQGYLGNQPPIGVGGALSGSKLFKTVHKQ